MHQSSISNRKGISRIFGLVLKMIHVHHFAYLLFHTCLKILLETRLNNLSRKKMNLLKWRSYMKVMFSQPSNPGRFLHPGTQSGPLDGNPVRLPFSEYFSTKWD